MTTIHSPADARPFRCRADRQNEIALDRHYRSLGNADVIAALVPHMEHWAEKPAPTPAEHVHHVR